MIKRAIDLIEEGKFTEARKAILEMNSVDIAEVFEELDTEKLLVMFRLLPKETAVDVFSYISADLQEYLIEAIADNEIQTIMDELFLDDTVDLLEEMPANIVKKILKNTSKDKRDLINHLLKYPENSAGSIMTIEYVDLKKEMTVRESLMNIKKVGVDKETINTCYVIDENRKLEGIVSLRKLIINEDETVIKDIMQTNIISINTHMDQEEIASIIKKYDLLVVPVVDNEGRLVGIITIDDVVDIIDQENTEDFQKMAAMQPSDEEYLKTGIFTSAKHRVGWLLVLMISATITGNIIKQYNDILQSVVILVSFIPMLMNTGGNSGSQSATLVIRGLALNEIQMRDVWKVLWKEFRVSIVVGFVLASVNFIRIYFLERTDLYVAITVCVSLFITVITAKLVGGILPIIAKKMKLDPAIMASPLVTTIVDAVALVTYFSIATVLMNI
ncbi:MAG: magnesium transporter [Dethiosulfatibacter sp.]|nr:magnesium transporter [Dethiosulfatibacter sp.]